MTNSVSVPSTNEPMEPMRPSDWLSRAAFLSFDLLGHHAIHFDCA